MATTVVPSGWLRGKVKAVLSGDSLVIMANSKAEIPPEKTITLSSIMAPRLASRRGNDEPFAWESREFLRKLCIGKEVRFRVDYSAQSGREFGSVYIGDKNVASLVVAAGWAKVKDQPSKGEPNEFLPHLQGLEDKAKKQSIGRWTKNAELEAKKKRLTIIQKKLTPGASEASVRDLPPSSIGDRSNFDVMSFLKANQGKALEALVEQVRDGSTLRVYLLPKFQFMQVLVGGVQAPSMGRKAAQGSINETTVVSDEQNGEAPAEPRAPLTSAKKLAASSAITYEVAPDPFAREAKHFTETRVLSREVRIVLEGVDKFNNLTGSVYYPDGESLKNLAIELVENGFAKYVEWSAKTMEVDAKRQLKNAELEAKKKRLRMWTNYVQRESNSKAIQDQKFTGKVVEVISGDCVIVADDSLALEDPSAEKRVNLSSIRCPRMGNPRKNVKPPEPYAHEAKEYLRSRLIGRQVYVVMEYSRKAGPAVGSAATSASNKTEMSFGSIFLPPKEGVAPPPAPTASDQLPAGVNVSELLVVRGFADVVKHRDFEERSNSYDTLLAAESRAKAGKKGKHSDKDAPSMNVTDLTTAPVKKVKDFLPFLQRNRKMAAVVEYVLSGHRFKLFIPKETCSITFSLSGVRCPGRNDPFSDEAIALMRRKIMQRDVEIEVETVDKNRTFLGSMWESKTNVASTLLEAGLAKFQGSYGTDKNPDVHRLTQAEQFAKKKKLKMWENFVEGEVVSNAPSTERRRKEELQVVVTEVMGGGKLYVQSVSDQKVAAIQNHLASLNLQEAPVDSAFKPKRGDIVLAQYSGDDSWYRVMIVNAPRGGAVESPTDKFEVFYIDYGNQETIPFSRLRPTDPSVSSSPGLAQLCGLAYIKTPNEEDDYGHEAGTRLSECLLSSAKEFKAVIEEKDSSDGKVKGKGTGTIFMVTLIDPESDISINALMLKEGLSRLEKRRRFGPKGKQQALDELQKYEEEAKRNRLGMWEYGDVQSDDEDVPPLRKAAGKR